MMFLQKYFDKNDIRFFNYSDPHGVTLYQNNLLKGICPLYKTFIDNLDKKLKHVII
jgi:hypothetical protein